MLRDSANVLAYWDLSLHVCSDHWIVLLAEYETRLLWAIERYSFTMVSDVSRQLVLYIISIMYDSRYFRIVLIHKSTKNINIDSICA